MKKSAISILLFSALLLTHCKPFKIAVSQDLAMATELPVKGRNGFMINQQLSFGNFATTKIKRSWTEGSEQNLGHMKVFWANYSQKSQNFHFTLKDDINNKAEVFCLSKVRAVDYTAGSNANSIINIMADMLGVGGNSDNNFAVSIFLNKEGEPWQILLDNESVQRNSKTYIGYLAHNKNNFYTIHPITALERDGKKGNILAGSIGFEIKNKSGKAVAAVSTMDKGIVYLANTEPGEKFLLANACAALLLQQNLG